MIIYKIENKLNGKVYIGQTIKSLKKRIRDHLNAVRRSYIKSALKKYGRENFDIAIIDTAINKDELNKKEMFWISKYGCIVPNGYNICKGGEGPNGYRHSKEIKEKMSISRKGKKQSCELIKKKSDSIKEFWSNPENRKRMMDSMRDKTPEVERLRRSESKKMYWSNPDNKKKLSERMIEFWSDHEKRKTQSENVKRTKALRKAA